MTDRNPGPAEMIDWDLAVRVGSRVAGRGPVATPDEAAAMVSELRSGAARSTGLVGDFTGLRAPSNTAPVLVVDRAGWVRANADGFATVLTPAITALTRSRQAGTEEPKAPSALSTAVGSRVSGVELGGLLGFLAGKVLGQFDPFHAPAGRLLLVAPNVMHIERELRLDPHDFRLWVCLHEETHRVQFTAVPWMRDHLFSEIQAVAASLEGSPLLEDGLQRVTEALRRRGRDRGEEGGTGSLLESISTPEQQQIMDRVTGLMSLLEGHADVVMDGVGPRVIPSVRRIRKRFNERRKGVGVLDRTLRRLLGLDAKMAQYRDGAVFVRTVVDKVGMEEFNAVWAAPEHLPSKAEITDPAAWIARVL